MIEFFVPCVPPTANHQNKKVVRIRGFSRLADRPELVEAKATLDALVLPHRKDRVDGPVRLSLTFVWPYPSGMPKKRQVGLVPKPTRPDCSNLAKTLEDRLSALQFIEDDAKVIDLRVRKFWGPQPGIQIRIEALEEIEQ